MAGYMGAQWHNSEDVKKISELEAKLRVRDNNINTMKSYIQSLKDRMDFMDKNHNSELNIYKDQIKDLKHKYDIACEKEAKHSSDLSCADDILARNRKSFNYLVDAITAAGGKIRYPDIDNPNGNPYKIEWNDRTWKRRYDSQLKVSDTLSEKVDNLTADVRNLKEENQHLRDTISGQCKKISKMSDYDHIQQELTEYKSKNYDKNNEIFRLMQKHVDLAKDYERACHDLDNLKKEYNDVSKIKCDIDYDRTLWQRGFDALVKSVKNAGGDVKYKSIIGDPYVILPENKEKIDYLRKKLDDLEARYNREISNHKDTKKHLEEAYAHLNGMKTRMDGIHEIADMHLSNPENNSIFNLEASMRSIRFLSSRDWIKKNG